MAEPVYRLEMLLGTIRLGRFTGRILTDVEGFSYMEQEDTITFDHLGREVKREAHKPVVRWKDEKPTKHWFPMAWWFGG